MTSRSGRPPSAQGFLHWLLGAVCAVAMFTAAAQPERVGRVVELAGAASLYDPELNDWVTGVANRPFTSGDRLWVPVHARAEIRIGSTTLRLGPATEIEALRLDDEALHFQLHRGQLALRVRTREAADEIEVSTIEARLRPLRAGHYRIDRTERSTFASSWSGELRVDGQGGVDVEAGRRVELWRDGRMLRHAWLNLPEDEFTTWAWNLDQADDRLAATRYVPAEMTGYEDLDRYGRWERHAEYGIVWFPTAVAVDWAPFRYGRWVWVRPWGWTWVDDARWGFAPFHYGRWTRVGGRWCWVPGSHAGRPVFLPAPVVWSGGRPPADRHWKPGGPAAWLPLAPHEPYRPHQVDPRAHAPRERWTPIAQVGGPSPAPIAPQRPAPAVLPAPATALPDSPPAPLPPRPVPAHPTTPAPHAPGPAVMPVAPPHTTGTPQPPLPPRFDADRHERDRDGDRGRGDRPWRGAAPTTSAPAPAAPLPPAPARATVPLPVPHSSPAMLPPAPVRPVAPPTAAPVPHAVPTPAVLPPAPPRAPVAQPRERDEREQERQRAPESRPNPPRTQQRQ